MSNIGSFGHNGPPPLTPGGPITPGGGPMSPPSVGGSNGVPPMKLDHTDGKIALDIIDKGLTNL